jgi:hypothetical protein
MDQLFLRDPTEYMSSSPHLRMERDPVSETCFLVFRIADDVQSRETEYFWVPYTIVTTIKIPQVSGKFLIINRENILRKFVCFKYACK